MTVWLYTEMGRPDVSGPFASLGDAMDAPLWESAGVCVWIEAHLPGGWFYENVKWCGDHWLVTSRGLRPLEPFRPHFLGIAPERVAA